MNRRHLLKSAVAAAIPIAPSMGRTLQWEEHHENCIVCNGAMMHMFNGVRRNCSKTFAELAESFALFEYFAGLRRGSEKTGHFLRIQFADVREDMFFDENEMRRLSLYFLKGDGTAKPGHIKRCHTGKILSPKELSNHFSKCASIPS